MVTPNIVVRFCRETGRYSIQIATGEESLDCEVQAGLATAIGLALSCAGHDSDDNRLVRLESMGLETLAELPCPRLEEFGQCICHEVVAQAREVLA